ncbi:MAG TPA: DUF2752 domain-containing protein [Verrucomicrobiae bacterium]|nr:DUF2752 domain-containing protein [Verrucomicrobiae bacterium]
MELKEYPLDAPPIIVTPAPRRVWWPMLVLAAAAASIGSVLFLFNPSLYGFYPRCMLYVTTGLYCPGCGALRASHQLLHGNVLAALHDNLLLVASVPCGAYYFLRRAVCWLNGRPAPPFVLQPKWIMALTIIVVCFTILRNIPIAPFTLLAPLK